jgi:hypothetical protein
MKKQLTFIIPVLFLLSFCKGVSTINSPEIGDSKYAILPFNPNEKYPIFKNAKPAELSHEEILDIEKIISAKISQTIKNHNNRGNEISHYSRQYVAVINANNEKEVWIQFYCGTVTDKELKTEVLRISDGGDCVFRIKVNLEKKIYYDYSENLYA